MEGENTATQKRVVVLHSPLFVSGGAFPFCYFGWCCLPTPSGGGPFTASSFRVVVLYSSSPFGLVLLALLLLWVVVLSILEKKPNQLNQTFDFNSMTCAFCTTSNKEGGKLAPPPKRRRRWNSTTTKEAKAATPNRSKGDHFIGPDVSFIWCFFSVTIVNFKLPVKNREERHHHGRMWRRTTTETKRKVGREQHQAQRWVVVPQTRGNMRNGQKKEQKNKHNIIRKTKTGIRTESERKRK